MARTKDLKFNHDFPLIEDEDFLNLNSYQQKFIYFKYLQPITNWTNGRIYKEAFNKPDLLIPAASNRAYETTLTKAISPLLRKLSKDRVEQLNITAERILAEESYIAVSDFGDLFDEAGIAIINPKDMPVHVRRAIKAVEEITIGVQTRYKVTFWSKSDALRRLQAVKGMISPKRHELTGKGGAPLSVKHTLTHKINLSNLTQVELEVLDKLISIHHEKEKEK